MGWVGEGGGGGGVRYTYERERKRGKDFHTGCGRERSVWCNARWLSDGMCLKEENRFGCHARSLARFVFRFDVFERKK